MPAGHYPEPSGDHGAPLADPNLKLAVMGQLLENEVLGLGSPEALAAHVLQRPVDLEDEGYDLLQPAYDYLVRYPLTQAQLDTVTKLTLDAGDPIYTYAWYHWDGESDEFYIHSFRGIEACRNLSSIDVVSQVAREAETELQALPMDVDF